MDKKFHKDFCLLKNSFLHLITLSRRVAKGIHFKMAFLNLKKKLAFLKFQFQVHSIFSKSFHKKSFLFVKIIVNTFNESFPTKVQGVKIAKMVILNLEKKTNVSKVLILYPLLFSNNFVYLYSGMDGKFQKDFY